MPQRTYNQGYQTGKLKPKHTVVNGIQFDSIFESLVYRDLKTFAHCEVSVQRPLEIKPATWKFPSLWLKIDFDIQSKVDPEDYLLVEAKGIITDEFNFRIQFFEHFHPDQYQRLLLVFPDNHQHSTTGKREIKKAKKLQIEYCFKKDLTQVLYDKL